MEVKKTQQIQTITSKPVVLPKEGPSFFKRFPEFIGDVKAEFKRITWTSKEELIVYTKAVVGATFLLGLGVYFVDVVVQTALWLLEGFVRLIIG